jgi:hypothetical protein
MGEAIAKMLEVVKPVATEATNTMKDLQQSAQNINRLTDENSELTLGAWPVQDLRPASFGSDCARQRAFEFAREHRKNQHQSHGEQQHRSYAAKSAELVRETKGCNYRAPASRRKHQAIQRDN